MPNYSILVVSKSEIPMQILKELLPKDQYNILFSSTIAQTQRLLIGRKIDLLIIDMPLKEESGLRFAQSIAQRSIPGLLLLMNATLYHTLAARMEEVGIPVLAKPLSHQALYQSVRLMCTLQKRIERYEKETLVLQDKMKEIQAINQAKWLLVEHFGYSEDKAHHFILKKAMDQCCTKYEIARQILKKLGGS
ncbi:ANTAR domain-containing response regulator [Merdibacter massiliensis]|uniref:ANTAR domain-containing response regulator n=1 Tax=Merdibacter massiliensis TaxID=1871030 RepID=UPI00096A38AB|nr:response regulator [Merdibacter massiliensis]